MKQTKLFRILFLATYTLLKMYGFLPLKFDRKSNRFRESAICLYYSVSFLVMYIWGIGCVYLIAIHVIHHEESLHNVFMRFQFGLNYCFLVVAIAVIIGRRNTLNQLLNTLILLLEMSGCGCHVRNDYKLLKRYSRKVLFVDFILEIIICLSYYLTGPDELIGVLTGVNFFFMWSIAIFASGFVSLCFVVAHIYRMINWRIDRAIQVLCDIEKETQNFNLHPTKKKLICLHVLKELNELAYLHRNVNLTVKGIVHLVDGPLLLTFIWYFLIVTFGVFYSYTALVHDIRKGLRPPLMKYAHTFGVAAFHCCQFYYVVSSAGLLVKRAEKTGVLLNRLYKSEVDERVQQTINLFSLELLHNSFALENLGMFKINYNLMYSVAATIATSLIVVIQFQLSH
ncbi:uncharacterized protein LOC134224613 [Armigeres subalbatus]|uniref:uncharacterized protein LOC134224613 n=1 Tax=Armigeres subalbatus TaxID=124917 RepID=UPI002ED11D81